MDDKMMHDEIQRHRFSFLSSIILSSIVCLTACVQPTTSRPSFTPDELARERQTQQRMIDEAQAKGGVPRPWRSKPAMKKQFDTVADRIEKAGVAVCQEMNLPAQGRACYFDYKLSLDRDVNAYADGKTVVVNYGMMRFVENDDELAGVVAHELAHNLMEHPKSSGRNAVIGAAFGTLLDAVAASQGFGTGGGFGEIGAEASVLHYSSDFEMEADYVGAYIMARAGYNPRRIAPYWRRMSVAFPDDADGGTSHPSNPERFVALQKTVEEIEMKKKQKRRLVPNHKAESL